MLRKYKKNLALLFAGSLSTVMAACYGAPIDLQHNINIKTVNNQNEAIPGLKVILTNNGERAYDELTNESGNVYFPGLSEDVDNDYQFIVEDIDGDQNGGLFLKQVIDVVDSQSDYSVVMINQ